MIPVAILAGGLGTRLLPATQDIPKAMMMVAGKPFIRHQLDLLHEQSVERIVVCAGHLGDMLKTELRDIPGVSVLLDDHVGTASALRHALPLLGDTFFVLYGDCYLKCSYSSIEQAFRKSKQPALMTVYRCPNGKLANVELSGNQILEYNKWRYQEGMCHRDYGLGILTRDALADSEPDLADVYHMLSGECLAGYEVNGRPYEIGSWSGLAETQKLLEYQ